MIRAFAIAAIVPAIALSCCTGGSPARSAAPFLVVDGHNDLLSRYIRDGALLPVDSIDFIRDSSGQTDLERWREGGVRASFVTIVSLDSSDPGAGIATTAGFFQSLAARYPGHLAFARTAADVSAAGGNRIALLLAIEGAEQLGADSATIFSTLDRAHALGVRSIGITWNHTNALADAALDSAQHGGLSPLGAHVIARMNALGMIVDLSHASEAAALEAIELSAAPVILSHSSAAALVPSPRNVSDTVLRRFAANGGVVMVTFVPYFTTREYADWYEAGEGEWSRLVRAHGGETYAAQSAMGAWESAHPPPLVDVADVADHIEHVRRIAGIDHVGLGSDFDGMYSHVRGLEDVATFPALLAELRRRGWNEEDVRRVAGANVVRVIQQVERIAEAR